MVWCHFQPIGCRRCVNACFVLTWREIVTDRLFSVRWKSFCHSNKLVQGRSVRMVAAPLFYLLSLPFVPFTSLFASFGKNKAVGAFEKLGRGSFYGPRASAEAWGRRPWWKTRWRILTWDLFRSVGTFLVKVMVYLSEACSSLWSSSKVVGAGWWELLVVGMLRGLKLFLTCVWDGQSALRKSQGARGIHGSHGMAAVTAILNGKPPKEAKPAHLWVFLT